MKKIINSKKYDTETAKSIGSYNTNNHGDFTFFYEELFKKRTGEYFLYGSGSCMSKYAVSYGNGNWGSGEEIIPMSYNTAKEWAENHLSVEEYEKEFGTIEEDETKISIGIRIKKEILEKIKREAAQRNITLSEYIETKLTTA